MSQTSQHKLYWLPNALTVGRILLIPVLVWAIMQLYTPAFFKSGFFLELMQNSGVIIAYPMAYIACFIFVVCMLTDFLDGYFARKWNITSDFGRMLDPIADKLLVAACLIAICIAHFGTWFILVPALIIIGRDITVSGVREYAALSRKVMPPTKLAKWKTAAEMFAILTFLLAYIFTIDLQENYSFIIEGGALAHYRGEILYSTLLMNSSIALLWLAAILSAYTGFRYFRAALVKTEVIDGPLDIKPFTDLTDQNK